MTALVYSTTTSFGGMTSQAVAKIAATNAALKRLVEAVAAASSGYEGTPGTEFETDPGNGFGQGNNFGVQPSDVPGEQGSSYKFALENLNTQWSEFMTAAEAFLTALDQGQQTV